MLVMLPCPCEKYSTMHSTARISFHVSSRGLKLKGAATRFLIFQKKKKKKKKKKKVLEIFTCGDSVVVCM